MLNATTCLQFVSTVAKIHMLCFFSRPPDNCPSVSEPAATSVPSNTSCFSENLKRSVDFVESGNEGSASLSGPSRKKRASSGRFICTSTSQSGQSVKKLRWEKTSTFRRERKLLGDASEGNETSPLSDSLRIVDRNAVSDMLDGSCATAAESEDCSMEAVVSAPLTGSTRKKKKPYGQVPMPWDCFRPLWNSIGGLISLQEKGRSLHDTDLAQSVAIPVDEGGARGERTAVQLYGSTNGILSPSRLLANHLPSSLEPDELLQPLVSKPLHSGKKRSECPPTSRVMSKSRQFLYWPYIVDKIVRRSLRFRYFGHTVNRFFCA